MQSCSQSIEEMSRCYIRGLVVKFYDLDDPEGINNLKIDYLPSIPLTTLNLKLSDGRSEAMGF
jgi:hypothetical protein